MTELTYEDGLHFIARHEALSEGRKAAIAIVTMKPAQFLEWLNQMKPEDRHALAEHLNAVAAHSRDMAELAAGASRRVKACMKSPSMH